jgi:hypothetical protein
VFIEKNEFMALFINIFYVKFLKIFFKQLIFKKYGHIQPSVVGKRIRTNASLLATLIRTEYICSNKEHNNYIQEQYFDNIRDGYPNNIFQN